MTNMEIASIISTLTSSVTELLNLTAAHNVNKTIGILLNKIQILSNMIDGKEEKDIMKEG